MSPRVPSIIVTELPVAGVAMAHTDEREQARPVLSTIFAGLAALAMLCHLSSIAAAAVADADQKLLDEIQALVNQASDRSISPAEMERLYSKLNQAEDQVKQAWQGASLAEINASRTGKLWKEGNSAILSQMQRRAATGTGTLGFLPSGKSFDDVDFDPRSSDFDATVLGPKSGQGVNNFVKAAPGDFLDRRKFTVMSGDGNFYRYRGGADTSGRAMTDAQLASARQKTLRQMTSTAGASGGYLSRGAMAGLEAQVAEGKYGGKVTFVDSTGKILGKMHVSRLGSLAERFGVIDDSAGDLLGMATDNHAQFANYLSQKGGLGGSAKILSRQANVIEKLPEDLKRTLKDDPAIRKALRDADVVSDALKKGVNPVEAMKAARISPDEFVKQAESISQRVIKAAGDDLVRRTAAATDPALRTGARLMLEQNVLAAIVNAGGVERFRAQHAGNKALLNLATDIEQSYGAKAVAGLVDRRQQALMTSLETAAKKAGIPEKVLAGMLGVDAASTAKAGAKTARGSLAAMVSGMGIDAAIATYHLANGNYEDAAISLAEGGVSYAMPYAGLVLAARDLTKLSMQFAVERMTGGYRDKRLQQTWEHIQNVIVAEHYDEFAKHMVGHSDWQTLMPYAEELLQDSGGLVRFHGLEAEVQRELAQQLFDIRHDVWRQYVTAMEFQRYLEARAFNEAYDRERERRVEGEILAALKRDDATASASDEKAKDKDPDKDTKDKPGAEQPDKKRAWDQPLQQQQQALAPGSTPPSGPDKPRAWDIAPGTGKPAQPERPAPPSSSSASGPATGTIVPWSQATERSVCLAYQNLVVRNPGPQIHARLKDVQNLRATGEVEVRDGRCLLAISGQWYEYPDGRTIRTIGNPLQSVSIDEARRALEKLDPTTGKVTTSPSQQTQTGPKGGDDCVGVRGAPRPNLPGDALLKWIRCNNVDPARR